MMCRTLVHEIGREPPKTTKELLEITTRHTSSEEAVGAAFILANAGTAMPTKATVKSTRKGAKGGKKGQKCQPHDIAITTSNGNSGEEAYSSGVGFVVAVEHDFKRRTWPPNDHFEKLLEVTCSYHPYPIKHKLKYCTMMKNIHDVRGTLKRQ
jgi:hypothetical protein